MQSYRDDDLRRRLRAAEERLAKLEAELRGLRSERRPRTKAKRDRYKGVITQVGGIIAGGSGEVTIYRGATSTTWKVTAWFNWMATGTLTQNTQVIVQYYADEDKWVIENAGCA